VEKQPCVYMLASRQNGTLYVGVTSDLIKRVWQHKNDIVEGFTRQHGVHVLVWYEIHEKVEAEPHREKQSRMERSLLRPGRVSLERNAVTAGTLV